jgi:hypothetical protein
MSEKGIPSPIKDSPLNMYDRFAKLRQPVGDYAASALMTSSTESLTS